MKLPTTLLLLILTWSWTTVSGQDYSKISELKQTVTSQTQREQVFTLCDIAWEFRAAFPDSCEFYTQQALRLSQNINFGEGISLAYRRLSTVWKYRNETDSALFYADKSIQLENKANRPYRRASAYLNKGHLHKQKGEWQLALEHYLSALKDFESIDSIEHVAKCHGRIGAIHETMEDYNDAESSYLKSLDIRQKNGDKIQVAKSYMNLGILYSKQKNFDKAQNAYLRSVHIFKKEKEFDELGKAYSNLAGFHSENNDLDSSIFYYDLAFNGPEGNKSSAHRINYGAALIAEGNPNKALEILNPLASESNPEWRAIALQNISKAHELNSNFELALKYNKIFTTIYDSLFTIKKYEALKTIQEKFDSESHVKRQLRLENEVRKKTTKIRNLMIAFISTIALFIIAILFIVIFRQRLKSKTQLAAKNEELHQQKVDELMKEKQLERLTALMEGQEQERAKIAADLHDGVGSLLSTVKHHFQVVEDKMEKDAGQMDKAQTLLDEACDEVRRISHDMASNVLSKFGLVAALQDLAESISSSETLKLELITTGIDERLENSKEIHLFRIAQELIGNTLKHAKASKASIQLTRHNDELNLIVEDNGVGFNPEEAGSSSGIGLENLKARVKHLDGHISFDSTHGKGTTVVVDIPFTS